MNRARTVSKSRLNTRNLKAVLVSSAVAIVAYFLLATWESGAEVLRAAARVTTASALLILGLSLVNYAIRYWRWCWYLREIGFRIPLLRGLQYYIAGFSFTTTPGKIGEAVRSVYLRQHNVSYVESLSVFFAERLSDLIAMVVLSCLAIWQFPQYKFLVGLVLAATVLFLVVIQRERALAVVRIALTRRARSRIKYTIRNGFSMLGSAARLLKPKMLLLGLVLSLVAWGAEGVAFYYILLVLDVEVSFWTGVGIYSISILIGALSFLPGGLGSTEAVMILLLVLAGAGQGEAITATLLTRMATLWFAVALGSLSILSITEPRQVNENG